MPNVQRAHTRPKLSRERVARILGAIEEKEAFILDLSGAYAEGLQTGDFSGIEECLLDWEATAELDGLPGVRESMWESYNKLVELGIVS